MTDRAAEWSAWKLRTFGDGYNIWHEGLDVPAVTRLRGAARERALVMLRLGLALDDPHAAQALAAMDDPASDAAVRAYLERASGSPRVRVAVELQRVHPEPALAEHLIAVLRGGERFSERIDAAIGLRHFDGAEDHAALLDAVGDRTYLVRYHACESLLLRRGRTKVDLASDRPDIFKLIVEPDDARPSRAQRAAHAAARSLLE